jgi:hypothetical protein
MEPSPSRVADAASLNVPVTTLYLRRLLSYVEAANEDESSEWRGSWAVALPELRRLSARSIEDTAILWGGVPTVADIVARMANRGLDSELIRRIREDVPLPRAPRAPPTVVLDPQPQGSVQPVPRHTRPRNRACV